MPDVDFTLLEVPRAVPVDDPEAYLRAAIAWHFGEDTGSAFWLRATKHLDFDPLTDIKHVRRPAPFPQSRQRASQRAVEELIPRGYGSPPPVPQIFESGGTTGAPKRTAQLPDWVEQVVAWQTEDFTVGGFVPRPRLPVHDAERTARGELLFAADLRATGLRLSSDRPRSAVGEEAGRPQRDPRGGRICRPRHRAGQMDPADPERRKHAHHPAAARGDGPQRRRCGPDQREDPLAATQRCARRHGYARRAP